MFKRPAPQRRIAEIQNGPGTFSVDIVGESRYQDALEEICGGRTEDGHRLVLPAMLILEDRNPHDPQAVQVAIDDMTVGYLDRDLARSFRKVLAAAAPEAAVAVCDAMIIGGWDRGGSDVGHFGVKLDLPTM